MFEILSDPSYSFLPKFIYSPVLITITTPTSFLPKFVYSPVSITITTPTYSCWTTFFTPSELTAFADTKTRGNAV
jgi:hypothetical protein